MWDISHTTLHDYRPFLFLQTAIGHVACRMPHYLLNITAIFAFLLCHISGSGLDYHADESLSEQQAVEADTAAAPAADSKESTQYPHPINPDSLTAGELDQLSKQIEGEQQQAFTIMDMDDVGLYRYDEYGNAVLRDGLSRAAQQGGGSSGSGAASAHVEL